MSSTCSFRLFLLENEAQDAAQRVAEEMKRVGDPANVQRLIAQLGAKSVNDLIDKVKSSPQFNKLVARYKEIKDQPPPQQTESFQLDENWFTSIMGGVGRFLKSVLTFTLHSVIKTIGHVFGGFFQGESKMDVLNYAGMCLLTFGLAPMFLATGNVPAAAATWGWSATWWGLMWFGKNVLEPLLLKAEPI
jgi:hypothetical protein